MTPTAGVPDVLARSRRTITPAMTAAVERLAPDIRRLVAYHLGWTDADGTRLGGPGGKGVRPTLALLSAQAAWTEAEVGVPGGVAVELIHNFSLIHDDIIDGDTERHHRPTVWSIFGLGPAIIAGDALQTLAHQILLEASAEHGPAAAAALAEATAAMIAGQADDIAFEKRRNVTVEECMAMSAAKTGALLGCAASIGAILAGAPPATVGALRDFGRHLGLSFQAVDDLLGIWGDPARTGKPAGNDLRMRKKSMPVVSALAAGGEEADELRALLLGPSSSPAGPPRSSGSAGAEDGECTYGDEAAVGGPSGSPTAASSPGQRRAGDGSARVASATATATSPAPANGARPEETAGPEPLGPLGDDEVERAAYLVEACGGREWTAVRAKAHLDAALGALDRVRLSAVPHRELADVAVFVVERES